MIDCVCFGFALLFAFPIMFVFTVVLILLCGLCLLVCLYCGVFGWSFNLVVFCCVGLILYICDLDCVVDCGVCYKVLAWGLVY